MTNDFDIAELEQMAKFSIPEDEKNELKKHMEFLVKDFEKLNSVDVGGTAPLIHGIELVDIFREDKVIKKIDRETLLENAPEHEKGYFKVPMTID